MWRKSHSSPTSVCHNLHNTDGDSENLDEKLQSFKNDLIYHYRYQIFYNYLSRLLYTNDASYDILSTELETKYCN